MYSPARHFEQEIAPGFEFSVTMHGLHSVCAAESVNVFSLHGLQPPDSIAVTDASVFPSSFEYLPGGHELQSDSLVAPVADEYLASGQLMQAESSEILGKITNSELGFPYCPALQDKQVSAFITLFAYCPTMHSLHSFCPEILTYPPGQPKQV